MVYSRKPPVLRHGQHAQLNIEGDLLIKNGLAERVEGEQILLQDHAQGVKALRHMQALEKLIVEMGEEEVA